MCPADRHRPVRRGGRGLRPWLLVPKLVAAMVCFGGLIATSFVWFAHAGAGSADAEEPLPPLHLAQVHDLFVSVVVPAAALAIVLGIVLSLQHPRVFVRLRWWQCKAVLVCVGIPLSHLFMASRLVRLEAAAAAYEADAAAGRQFSAGLVAVVALTLLVVVLGRIKPNLRQNWARSFTAIGRPPPSAAVRPGSTGDGGTSSAC